MCIDAHILILAHICNIRIQIVAGGACSCTHMATFLLTIVIMSKNF